MAVGERDQLPALAPERKRRSARRRAAKRKPAHNPRAHGGPPTVAPFRAWRGSKIPTSPEDSGPASWSPGRPAGQSLAWRRGWDLNPRSTFWADTRFPVVHLRPLGHLSRILSPPDKLTSGERGIRTPGTVPRTPDFESGAFDQLGQLSAGRSSRFPSGRQARIVIPGALAGATLLAWPGRTGRAPRRTPRP